MEFTWEFIRMFAIGLFYAAPLLATLALIIVVLGHVLGRLEGWSNFDALYHAFSAATTLGYGDFHPRGKRSKLLAIAITFVGIIFTGILVAIALHSAAHAFKETHNVDKLIEQVDE
ncbi:MAG: potassium channel family protein [Thiogranum sp.]